MRDLNVAEHRLCSARKVLRVWMSYNELVHSLGLAPKPVPAESCADVSFIGTQIRHEERDEFLPSLRDRSLQIAVGGDRWQKSPPCLGLLSGSNRDLHTTRSLETPYAGGLLCAQRTSEHLALCEENREAVFWSHSSECAEGSLELLAGSERRERIRIAGMRHVRENGAGIEDICRQILTAVTECE